MNALVFILGLLLLGIVGLGALLVAMTRKGKGGVDDRLAQFTGGAVETSSPDFKARVNEAVTKTERGSGIARDLAKADLRLTAGEFVLLKIISAIGIGVVAGWLSTQFAGRASLPAIVAGLIVGGVLGSFVPNVY